MAVQSTKQKTTIASIPKELYENRKLIFDLSKNDFKSRFAGSYFGIIWAFVQPVVTVLVYWFVFEKALNAGTQSTKAGIDVPYVLWLISGMVPWFFFAEVLSAGTNAFLEYDYLVKKVVFKISALPAVKVISSIFVHLFFIGFMLIFYFIYHFQGSLYMLQIIYYSLAMMIMVLGMVYATSAMVVFFRDLTQLITILLQVLMWMTPILWSMDTLNRVPGWVSFLLKLNPMYYIVTGYRDALFGQTWFWERPITIYYWVFTLAMLLFGTTVFRKLQPHFADVL